MAFLSGDYNLCVSNEIIEEYSEVLSRNISPQVSEAIVYAILTRPNVIRKDPHYTFALIGKHPTPILAVWTISATFAPC